MKKRSVIIILFSFLLLSLAAQTSEDSVNSDLITDTTETELQDDFDSIFEEAQDLEEPVVDEAPEANTPLQIITSAFSSMVHFSGNFNGDVGIAYAHLRDEEEGDDNVSGFFSLKNTLNMTVTPVSSFAVRGSLYTGIDNGFTIDVPYFYFDYLLLDRIYISAGKKGISWGNIRLFNSDYYGCETHSGGLYSTGPAHADIFSEDDAPLAMDLRYPWSWGTITLAATGNYTNAVQPNNFNYYGSFEFSVLNTNFNLYAKRPAKNTEPEKNELLGLEIKRTILGFDAYAQGIVRVKDIKSLNSPEGYDYVVATAGFYRLFESFEPNLGFNIEYQHEYNPSSIEKHYDRLAFEGGLKRIGKRKNIKLGVLSHFNITERHGYSGLNLIVSGILPYADWSSKLAVGYGSKYIIPTILASTSVSIALNY